MDKELVAFVLLIGAIAGAGTVVGLVRWLFSGSVRVPLIPPLPPPR